MQRTPSQSILIIYKVAGFIPGSQFIFSNADTAALGLALSKVTSTPVYNFMKPLWDEIGANHNAF